MNDMTRDQRNGLIELGDAIARSAKDSTYVEFASFLLDRIQEITRGGGPYTSFQNGELSALRRMLSSCHASSQNAQQYHE